MTTTSRAIVRVGIAQFFGGTNYDQQFRCYRGGPLLSHGLSTVRPYQPKREPDTDYVMGLTPGRGMGAIMALQMAETRDTSLTITQLPSANNGQRRLVYPVRCHLFHLAHLPYAEDAEADVDALAQAISERIYTDPTLGGICYQAGLNSSGIRTVIDDSVNYKEIIGTHFYVAFDVEVQTTIVTA